MAIKSAVLIILFSFSSILDLSFSLKDHMKLILKGGDHYDSSTKCDNFYEKKFIERATSDIVVYNTQEGQIKAGDITVWNNELYNGDNVKKVGNILGYCIFLPELVYECSATLRLDHGSIMLQGVYLDNPDYLAVTGGTQCYNDIIGEVRVNAGYLGNATNPQYKVM